MFLGIEKCTFVPLRTLLKTVQLDRGIDCAITIFMTSLNAGAIERRGQHGCRVNDITFYAILRMNVRSFCINSASTAPLLLL